MSSFEQHRPGAMALGRPEGLGGWLGLNGGVADSLDEAKAAFRAAWSSVG